MSCSCKYVNRPSRCWIGLLLVLIGLYLPNFALATTIRFSNLTTTDGLSQMSVDDLLQDKQGFIWIATQDGLNRYDGYQFKVFRHHPDDINSLADNRIYDLFIDRDDNLWVGTAGGLHLYDPKLEQFTRYVHKVANDNSISGNMVMSIDQDNNGFLWLASYTGGVSRFNIEQQQFVRLPMKTEYSGGLLTNRVVQVKVDRYNDVWIASNGAGVSRYLSATSEFEHFRHRADDDKSLSSDLVKGVVETPDGDIWVATLHHGVNSFERKFKHFHPVSLANKPFSLSKTLVDSDGYLWMGSFGDGIFRRRLNNKVGGQSNETIQLRRDVTDRYSLASDHVTSIMEDNGGVIWIGTHGGGISTYNTAMKRFKHFKHHANRVNSQSDSLPSSLPNSPPNSLPNNVVWSLFEDNKGVIWIATNGTGVSRLNVHNDSITPFYPPQSADFSAEAFSKLTILAIFQDSAGVMWFGSNGKGVFSYDEKTDKFSHYAHQPNNANSLINDIRVGAIVEDKNQQLWIGTGGGLSRLNKDRDTFFNYTIDDNSRISSNIIQSLFVDRDNVLWVGHYNQGVDRYDEKNDVFTGFRHQFQQKNSLSNNTVYSIFQSQNGLMWFGTAAGLNQYNSKSQQFTHYRSEDGLSNDTVMGIVPDKLGYLWLTTHYGLNRFDPQSERFDNFFFSDGIAHNEFSSGAHFVTRSGLALVGGVNGFNMFNPADIELSTTAPNIVFTELLLNNREVAIGQKLSQSINFTSEIVLDYNDNVFALGFSALDYTNPAKNFYRYQLQGFDQDWIVVDANHRRVTYTNLDPGQYTFTVTGSNSHQQWQPNPREIKITIVPPPWRSWWAYSLYTLAVVLIISIFIVLRVKKVKAENKAAAVLAGSEKQLRLALWGSGDQLWDWHVGKQLIERKNIIPEFDLPLTQKAEQLQAKGLSIHPEDQTKFDQAMGEHLAGDNEYFECKYRLKDAKGQWRWVLDRGKVFETDEHGQPLRITGTMQDVHDIHIAQQTLTVLNESLERQVAGRTKALQNSLDQLKAAQKHIVEAEKMASLGTLVAGVAHEVNTPLGICITMISTLMDYLHELNEKFDNGAITRKYLESFIQESAQCQELVDSNLLRAAELIQSFKQVAVDQTEDNPVDMLFADYLADIVRTMRSKLINRHIELRLDVAGEWIVNSHPSAWWQLLTNLIENSCAHGFHHQPQGQIAICATLDNKNHLKVIYTDNGVGMDELTLKQIYDPFFTTARHREHIGLGMHIVYNLVVQKLGGTIDCHSSPDNGVEIFIEVFVG